MPGHGKAAPRLHLNRWETQTSGAVSVNAVVRTRPQVVTQLPDLPPGCFRELSGDGVADDVKTLFTGFGTDEDVRRSKEAGFDFYLVKPIDLHELQTVLDQVA